MSDEEIVIKKIKPLTLVINPSIWEEFKSNVTRDITLNNQVVELIKEYNLKKKVSNNG